MADNLSPEQRSYCMSRVKAKNTGLEKIVFSHLRQRGLRFRKHVGTLPGKPDVVFSEKKVAVFIDGDFWHGYRFPVWEDCLSDFWRIKIGKNRARDRKNFAALNRKGWKVIRVWGHQVNKDIDGVIERISEVLSNR